MRQLVISVLMAAVTLAGATGIASAETGLGASPSTTTLTFPSLELEGGLGSPIRCPLSLNVTLHESVAKSVGALAGQTNIIVGTGRCTIGDLGLLVRGARVTTGGPYHVQYTGFSGALPDISSVGLRVVGVEFWIRIDNPIQVACLTNGPQQIAGTTTGGNPATGMDVRAQNVSLTGGLLCLFASITLNGTGTLSSSVTISLI